MKISKNLFHSLQKSLTVSTQTDINHTRCRADSAAAASDSCAMSSVMLCEYVTLVT